MKVCKYCDRKVKDSVTVCPNCGAGEFLNICSNCNTEYKGKFCPNCGTKHTQQAKICPECGTEYYSNACPECGYVRNRRRDYVEPEVIERVIERPVYIERDHVDFEPTSPRKRLIAFFICYIFGLFGGHYFYVGRTGKGIAYLCTFGWVGIGWFIDMFVILSGRFKDSRGRLLKDWV